MTALAVAFRFGAAGYRRDDPLPVVGPAGTCARLESGYDPVAHDPATGNGGYAPDGEAGRPAAGSSRY